MLTFAATHPVISDNQPLTAERIADVLLQGVVDLGTRDDGRIAVVLIALLRNGLRPYGRALLAVVVLQLFGTLAALYLPSLNADIIDNGVAQGDTAYILRVGAVMLAVTCVQIVCSIAAVYFGARTAMGFGRDTRAAGLPPGRLLLRP